MKNNEKYKVIVINKYSLGFDSVKTKENSPLVVNLEQDLSEIELPSNLLELDTLIVDLNTNNACSWFRIFIGSTSTLKEIDDSKKLVSYSEGLDYKDLLEMKPEDGWAFYKNEVENPVLLAKLKPLDIVVSSVGEAKMTLINLSSIYKNENVCLNHIFEEKNQILKREK